MSVRRASVEDADGIARVHVTTWQVAYRGVIADEYLDALDSGERAVAWRERLTAGVGTVFVAVEEESVVGFIAVGPSPDEDCLQLFAIYVLPSHWGSGAAAELLDAAVDSRMTVLWTLADNPRARRFYERHGFAFDGGTQNLEFGGREVPVVRYRRASAPGSLVAER
ncbi:N-acetyltransferase [Lentzea sp. NBRC 105346]|uniref:GNAT family N-acetyltransferase n=1 Tax=Lentzea sp. NBRC 105346 TaxID=3032205 RepID=UPI0024A30005|nr:GNAT family N-acetyltransferase [Lentzea sp. NBRC 105346]GLZ34424.1 N-acetyltransferase [Lentzea sp. NBRC 105346]